MNVAIWLLGAVLALPFAEIAVFVLVAIWIGFLWALLAVVSTSLLGALMLRLGGDISRMKVVLGSQRVTALETDGPGTMRILAAILLLIPGFITDVIGVLLLIAPLRRLVGALLLRAFAAPGAARPGDGVVDLDPEEWRQVPNARLRDERERRPGDRP
jgi:UPF0716 protein FxsA